MLYRGPPVFLDLYQVHRPAYHAARRQAVGLVRIARARAFEREERGDARGVLFEPVDAAAGLFHVFDEQQELPPAEVGFKRRGERGRSREGVDDRARVCVEPLQLRGGEQVLDRGRVQPGLKRVRGVVEL